LVPRQAKLALQVPEAPLEPQQVKLGPQAPLALLTVRQALQALQGSPVKDLQAQRERELLERLELRTVVQVQQDPQVTLE
jgi:hypothetical protein